MWRKTANRSIIIMLTMSLSACVGYSNYAPVRNYYRDIRNTQKFYIVKKGDTLYSIGYRSGHGYKRLADWNEIPPPYRLEIGQRIQLFKTKQKLTSLIKKQPDDGGVKKTRSLSQKSPTFSNDKKKVLKLHWQWPIKGKVLRNFSQTGMKGIDIDGSWGQPVRAAASGKVVYSGHGLVGYGNLLIIKHNSLYLSAYGNNRRLLVKEGQLVNKGQAIAEVGKVGDSQTSLHFEIRKQGKPVNPEKYLPKR